MPEDHTQQPGTFDVHLYCLVRVKVPGIVANNHLDALAKAEAQTDLHRVFELSNPETTYVEEIPSALIDHVGDEDHSRSTWYDTIRGEWARTPLPSERKWDTDDPAAEI